MPTPRSICHWSLVACFAAATVAHVGAQDDDRAARQAATERSRAIQGALAHVDAHRAEFVQGLLMEWASHVDPDVYDLFGTLGPIAMRAPAWQLYGASLVGDFATMVRILRGEEGAGAYVERLAGRPEPLRAHGPQWEVVEPDAFGSNTDNLVYTPIAPCRVVDTRGAGARQGVIPANGTRNFDLTTAAFVSGQGASGPCPGLPAFGQPAWAVNLTVTGYSAVGGLKAWGFGGVEPNASIINYAPGISAIANGVVLTGCYGCLDDVTIKAFTAGTHVIIDVIGYFLRPEVSASVVTRHAGDVTSVPADSGSPVLGASCPAGTQLVGGEVSHFGQDTTVAEFRASGAIDRWFAYMINREAVARNVTVTTWCRDAPVRFP